MRVLSLLGLLGLLGCFFLFLSPATAAEATRLPAPWQAVSREVFQQLIELNTTHEKGATVAVQALAQRFRAAGVPDSDLYIGGPLPHKQNLVVRFHGQGKARPVLFVLHLDVVAAKREDWSADPFKFLEKDGYFYGRGTLDMKNEVAGIMATLLRFKKEGYKPDRDLIVAFTDDEEGGDENGVKWLLQNQRPLVDAGFAINPDVGGGRISKGTRVMMAVQTSEKVFLSFQLEAKDRGGHSSVPHAGNPIFRLAGALVKLGAFQFPVHLNETTRGFFASMAAQEKGQRALDLAALGKPTTELAVAARLGQGSDVYSALMRTTCVATELSGGHAENALPQTARATINCRILPDEKPEQIEATLKQVIADEGITMTRIAPPKPSPPSPLVDAVMQPVSKVLKEMFPGVRLTPTMSLGASDSVFLRNSGIPTYGVSGMFTDMDDPRAHGRDERIGVVDFYDGVEFMYRFTKALTGAP